MAMARVQVADLEKRDGWVQVIAERVSVLNHRGSGRVSVGGVSRSRAKIPWGFCVQALDDQDRTLQEMLYLLSVSTQIHEGCEENGTGGSGHILFYYDRESSVVMTGLSLGPRGSGAVNTVAAGGNPSFAGPPLALEKCVRPRTSAGGAADIMASGIWTRWPGI